MAFSDVLGAALPMAGYALGGPAGGAIGSFAGGLALSASAGDKMKDFERRDRAIPTDDPEQRGYLNRLAQQERYYRSGSDSNTGLANRLAQQSGAQTQSNLVRAGGPGVVQNLLSSQNVTNRGLAQNAAQAAGMADNMMGMQGQLINMMASRRYDRQRYRRDLALMQGQQQQQNANNMFSSALGTIGTMAGGVGGEGGFKGLLGGPRAADPVLAPGTPALPAPGVSLPKNSVSPLGNSVYGLGGIAASNAQPINYGFGYQRPAQPINYGFGQQ